MMFARHSGVASQIVQQLEGHPDSPFLAAAASSVRVLSGTMGGSTQHHASIVRGSATTHVGA